MRSYRERIKEKNGRYCVEDLSLSEILDRGTWASSEDRSKEITRNLRYIDSPEYKIAIQGILDYPEKISLLNKYNPKR
jgi:hypothetical protein